MTNSLLRKYAWLTYFNIGFCLLFLNSCLPVEIEDEQTDDTIVQSVTISSTELNVAGGSVRITYSAEVGTPWSAEITEGGDFVSFSISGEKLTTSGSVASAGTNTLYVYYDTNDYSVDRLAAIQFELEGEDPYIFYLKQLSMENNDNPYTSSGSPRWSELPTYVESDNYLYVVHYTPSAAGVEVRNFSLCFDIENRAAAWVAFPYHSVYTGSSGRNEKWTYDPKIPWDYQADLSSSYGSYGGNSYDRGHQIASNDRQATVEMNQQTFYFSNMTPQLGTLNQQKWATVETMVRNQICSDTLFVVTGADYSPIIGYSYDASGNACAIPSGYFKVLLRTRTGYSGKAVSECSASELQAIGFWFDHEKYSAVPDPVSVSYIEQKTGFNFFPTVPEEVKSTVNTSDWSF